MQAGVVGEQPVVAQRHVLLLPLLVEGLAAALQEDALREKSCVSARRAGSPPARLQR